ncbi:class I SAM-dependent methyltransferase [Vibrio tritonius]|uniref:class I SAM-dependent methyltransferase n=1 Tax=Vibrio tritonius TaxID=1435069 RepID=UPI0008382983|nr:class I SAM-dependent methyltransferase [Vibrio tritonius]
MNNLRSYFDENAEVLSKKYDIEPSEIVHEKWIKFIDFNDASILDIGCGSGRDAIFMSREGGIVTAVDISENLISIAKGKDESGAVNWIVDSLPELKMITETNRYDLILLSAVLMFLNPKEQLISIKNIVNLMKDDGMLVFSIKEDDSDPLIYKFNYLVLDYLGCKNKNITWFDGGEDILNRKEVSWRVYVVT